VIGCVVPAFIIHISRVGPNVIRRLTVATVIVGRVEFSESPVLMAVEVAPTRLDVGNSIAATNAKFVPTIVVAEVIMLWGNFSMLPFAVTFGFCGKMNGMLGKVQTLIAPFAGIGILIRIPILMVPEGLTIGVELRLGASGGARRQRH